MTVAVGAQDHAHTFLDIPFLMPRVLQALLSVDTTSKREKSTCKQQLVSHRSQQIFIASPSPLLFRVHYWATVRQNTKSLAAFLFLFSGLRSITWIIHGKQTDEHNKGRGRCAQPGRLLQSDCRTKARDAWPRPRRAFFDVEHSR